MLSAEAKVEFIGSFLVNLLVFSARGASILLGQRDALQIGLVYGFATMCLVLIFFPAVRCHFTPLLTVVDIAFKGHDLRSGTLSILAQFTGCLLAACLAALLLGPSQSDKLAVSALGTPGLQPQFGAFNGFCTEFIFAGVLGYAHCRFSRREDGVEKWVELYAAMRCVVLLLAAVNGEAVSGISLNPFAVITPATIGLAADASPTIFIVAPVLGALCGGFLHQKVIATKFNE